MSYWSFLLSFEGEEIIIIYLLILENVLCDKFLLRAWRRAWNLRVPGAANSSPDVPNIGQPSFITKTLAAPTTKPDWRRRRTRRPGTTCCFRRWWCYPTEPLHSPGLEAPLQNLNFPAKPPYQFHWKCTGQLSISLKTSYCQPLNLYFFIPSNMRRKKLWGCKPN